LSIESTGLGTFVIILVMVVVTLLTRWGGLFIMSFVPISYRVQQFISAMSGSVLVAVVAPMAVTGDHGARLALLTTAIVMLLLRKPIPAIAAGVVAAAVFRQI
jgi:uncharacterized membrane protein